MKYTVIVRLGSSALKDLRRAVIAYLPELNPEEVTYIIAMDTLYVRG
ncbi:MAG: hypothetical protein ACLQVJ_17925 [Syntrophobacteraceae bacterium]